MSQNDISILKQLDNSQYNADDKYHALKQLENVTNEKIDLLKKQVWADDESIKEKEKAITIVSESIKKTRKQYFRLS